MSEKSSIRDRLSSAFSRYTTENLITISEQKFRAAIESRLGVVDYEKEGIDEAQKHEQRDLSVKFHWGHNHDFGSFQVAGRMADRHLDLLANFVSFFPIDLEDFDGKKVFDVGCWTGGTTLLLAALGSKVHAIEEVNKYAETTEYLIEHFGLRSSVNVDGKSLYDCNVPGFQNQFDIAYMPGVIYHLTDPILALRILYNSLKLGGKVLLESEGIDVPEPYCRFDGSMIITHGDKEDLNRGGWNWFIPSASALERMMREAGFDDIETDWDSTRRRVYAYGVKRELRGVCKAGLSVPGID